MNTAILIPARYGSTRYPGKPLTMLNGKTMIQRVAETCKSSGYDTYVLTDNKTIAQAAQAAGVGFYIDTDDYDNGTERCAGAILSRKFNEYDYFVNVQGDMPDVTLDMIEKAIMAVKYYPVGTVFTDMPEDKRNDPNSVKMVRAGDQALWFGRGMTGYGEWHLGIYGYRRNALEMYNSLDTPLEERVEKLEQLRWLKAGWDIGCLKTVFDGIEVNTPEDARIWNDRRKSLGNHTTN
jgi:3-deoxy-manno-octulosonate cytidylyltransferase (CMP-KDO synthetase)